MAKRKAKAKSEESQQQYAAVNEIPEITAKAEAKGLKLIQTFHCSTKKKSYILIPGAGEPGLLYTDDVKQLETFIEEFKNESGS